MIKAKKNKSFYINVQSNLLVFSFMVCEKIYFLRKKITAWFLFASSGAKKAKNCVKTHKIVCGGMLEFQLNLLFVLLSFYFYLLIGRGQFYFKLFKFLIIYLQLWIQLSPDCPNFWIYKKMVFLIFSLLRKFFLFLL
jgi:hypothetical protein